MATVTGVIQDAAGNTATSGNVVFKLSPWSPAILYRVGGVTLIAPTIATCGIDATGHILNLTLSGACQVWGNDNITPANTCYQVVEAPGGVIDRTIEGVQITGSGGDLSSPTFCPNVRITPEIAAVTTAPSNANVIPGTDNFYNVGGPQNRYAQGYFNNLTVSSALLSKSFENIRYADQFTGANFSAKEAACNTEAISVTGGTCDAYALSGQQTISAETPVGNTSGNSVLLRLPPYILATVSITDGTSCGVKLYDKSSILGAGTGGSSNTHLLGQNGTSIDSLFCTDPSSSGQYVNAEGIELFNPTGSTAVYANGLANIQHLFDNSRISRIFARAPGVTGFFAHDFCCGTEMSMIGANGFGAANSQPCIIGKNGEHANGILIGFSCVHPGDTKNAFKLNSSGSSYSALDALGSYTECNTTDLVTPLFQLNGGANDSIGMYGVAEAGPNCAGGTLAYLIDIAAAMKGGILTNIRRGGLANTINDHANSRTSNSSYVPLYAWGGDSYISALAIGTSQTFTGSTGTGTSVAANINPTFTSGIGISDAAGTNRQISFNTSGVARTICRLDNIAEGGANSGSNFECVARDDAGALLGKYFHGDRPTLDMTFGGNISPDTAGAKKAGTAALPFSAVCLGASANNTACLGGVFTANRTPTLPDNSGVVAELNLAQQWSASQTYTDGSFAGGNAPTVTFVTSAYTNATTTFSNVTNLSFAVVASKNYKATCRITWQGSASTAGPKYQFTGPAAPTAVAVGMNSVVTATTTTAASAVAFSSPVANAGTVTATTNFTDTIDIGLVNGANAGTVQLQAAANGVGTLTIQPGSYCSVQ